MPSNTQNTPNVERVAANIFLVDPNPPGMGMIPPEDMFIYVKFSAFERNRSDLVETIGEINFIATEVNYNAEGEIEPSPQKTYATTNYSKIGGTVDANSRGILEGFGIKSIDIKYDASLVPQVDITFTDIRGASLFDVIDNDNRKSPYSIFFKMPYPIFKLSVKGYFGKTVDYCLHMTNWTSNFDGSTGNFDISANFVGFQQAFLADMVIGNIIGAVNTEIGVNKLYEIYNNQQATDPTLDNIEDDIKQLDDFLVRISKLQLEFEDIKEKNDEFEVLKTLNELYGKLTRLQSFVGVPIKKDVDNDTNIEYLKQTNKTTQVETSPIADNSLVVGSDYLSIRDILLVNSIRLPDIKEYFNTLQDITKDYNDFLVNKNKELGKVSAGEITKESQASLIQSFKIGESYEKFLLTSQPKNPNKIDAVFTIFNTPGGILNEGPLPAQDPLINAQFSPTDYFDGSPSNDRTVRVQKMSLDNNVFIFDLREIRSQVQNTLINLRKSINTQQEVVQKKLNETLVGNLKMNPSISNIFRIICNNTDAMLLSLKELKNNVNGSNNQEQRKKFIVKQYGDKNSDIPVKFNEFMWPTVYQTSDDKGSIEIYLGDNENLDIELFPEVKFTEDVFTNLSAKRSELNQITKATAGFAGNDTDNWFPVNPLDYDVNPFLRLNILNDTKVINEEMVNQIIRRISIIKNYSNFTEDINNKSPLQVYGTFDGINANLTTFAKVIRDYIENNILKTNPQTNLTPLQNVIDTGKNSQIFKKINNGFELLNKPITPNQYIILDNTTSDIVNNSKKLWSKISENKDYKKITSKKVNSKTYNTYYYNNNLTNNLFNHVWLDSVNNKLITTDKNNDSYVIRSINVIDGGTISKTTPSSKGSGSPNVTNQTSQNVTTSQLTNVAVDSTKTDNVGRYINILNPTLPSNNQVKYETLLTDNAFYNNISDDKGRAVLLLSTLPFNKFKKVLDVIKEEKQTARVLNLPTYYLYFIGGLLARYKNDFLGGWNILSSPKEQYINKIGVLSGDKTPNIENELINLPDKTKQELIYKFENWVGLSSGANGFLSFETLVKTYKTTDLTISEETKKSASDKIINELNRLSKVVLTAPTTFFNTNKPSNTITANDISDYLTGFKTAFEETVNEKGTEKNTEKKKTNSNETESSIKLQIYNYFKNINNKWVADDNKQQQVCGANNELFDYFKFIDRGWADIGDKAVINLDSILILKLDDKNRYHEP